MRERWHMPLAMWRVHFDLLGGTRRAGLIVFIYAVALALGLYLFRRAFADISVADFSAGFVDVLVPIQGLILVAGGSTSIYRAMLRDFDTRMLESHRLTPMSNVAVIVGYATGPSLQILFIAFLNLAAGTLFSLLGQKPLTAWLGCNALFLAGAAVFWSFSVLIGLRRAKPLNPTVFLALVGMFAAPTFSIPAVASFLGVYPVFCGFLIGREDAVIPLGLSLLAGGVSVVITLFWFAVAAAKYRRPDLPALNGLRGLALLMLWLLLSVGGLHALAHPAASANLPSVADDPLGLQIIVMLLGGMVLSWIPISGAVECALIVGRGGSPRNFGDRMRDGSVTLWTVLLLAGVPAALAWPLWTDFTAHRDVTGTVRYLNEWTTPALLYGWLPIGATMLAAAFLARGIFRTFYAKSMAQRVRPIAVLLGLCVIPLVLDLMRMAAALQEEIKDGDQFSALAGFSPVGTVLAVLTSETTVPLYAGLAFQLLLVVFFTLTGRRAIERRLASGAVAESE